ncbi:MAG: hypothetical protein NVSMB23_25110 [Myxococcales bacterium]
MPAHAAALHAERAALLERAGRFDEAVQACALALSAGGVDLAVLRRLLRLQHRRGDHAAALAVLQQIAQALPEGPARAEAYARAGALCERNLSDEARAIELHALASAADPAALLPLAARARLSVWAGRFGEAATIFEQLAGATVQGERLRALRWAAALRAHRTGERDAAAERYRALLAEAPGDLPAMASLLELLDLPGAGVERTTLHERAELRGRLAGYCQDPRVSAQLRARAAEDRLAAGEREQGIADYRRALALNPNDRLALDALEQTLRAGGERQQLADHLAFRSGCEDGDMRSALLLQRAELLAEDGKHDEAEAVRREALEPHAGLPPAAAAPAGGPPPAAPPASIAELRAQLTTSRLAPESFRALAAAFERAGNADAASCAVAVLVGLGLATPDEKAAHDSTVAGPLPAELSPLADDRPLLGEGDEGPGRELLRASAPALSRALPTELAGRADRVKGDNPVRRLCAAIARALGLPQEPALFAARSEPGLVIATATEPPGLLVGSEVPRRFTPRQQRFLYARAIAHLRARSQALVGLPPAKLRQVLAELVRACAPPGPKDPALPPPDHALGEKLRATIPDAPRAKLAPLAAQVAREGLSSTDDLALGLRETAERTALVLCGDPAAALSIVAQECPGGLARPEVARLARFAVSDAFLALRAR